MQYPGRRQKVICRLSLFYTAFPFFAPLAIISHLQKDFFSTSAIFQQASSSGYNNRIQWASQLVPCIDKTWSDSGAIKIKIRNKNEPWSAPDGIKEETTESSPHESFLQADRPQMINLKKLWWYNVFVFVFVFCQRQSRKKCWEGLDDNNTLQ